MSADQLTGLGAAQPAESLKPRTGLVTLLFTDMVGSTALKQQLGDQGGAALFRKHHQLVRELLGRFPTGQEIETAGDSFLIVFSTPSDAVRFGLLLQSNLRGLREETGVSLFDRIGIHVGEVVVRGDQSGAKPREIYGIQIDTCSRVMSLAKGGQALMSRGAFDSARQVLKGEDIEGVGQLEWLNHGPYLLKGLDEAVEICEVREAGKEAPSPPTTSEKAQRKVSADEEPVLGWRPAIGQRVSSTQWILEKKLGEGGFGEVWLGRHQTMKERRVFKFCFRLDRVRSLKREMTLFRVLKERVGHHPNIVGIQEVYFDAPPFYIVMDYADGQDLRAWCDAQGGADKIPLATRLEIVAQVGDALQVAHEAGVIHRDVKPSNILISNAQSHLPNPTSDIRSPTSDLQAPKLEVKLTDFGIGQVVSEEVLAGMTRMGFTQTMLGPGSSSQAGTQLYMAPELMAGQPASIRSDIYSLGVVLYQLLIGDLARPLTTDWVRRIADPLLREDLEKCFAGDAHERFTGAAELTERLRSLERRTRDRLDQLAAQSRRDWRRKRLFWAGVAAALVLTVALVGHVINPRRRAYQHYLKGNALLEKANRDDVENAILEYFSAAADDPTYAASYIGLANAYLQKDSYYEPGLGWNQRALEAVASALKLDPKSAEAYAMRGWAYYRPAAGWNWSNAVQDLRYATRLNPELKLPHARLAYVYWHLGMLEETVVEAKRALAIDPTFATPLSELWFGLTYLGDHVQAREVIKRIPVSTLTWSTAWKLGLGFYYANDTNRAAQVLDQVYRSNPDRGEYLVIPSIQAVLAAAAGQTNRARAKIDEVLSSKLYYAHRHHALHHLAGAYAMIGSNSNAVQMLTRAAAEGYPCYPCFRDDPLLQKLHGDPLFEAFLADQKRQFEERQAVLRKTEP